MFDRITAFFREIIPAESIRTVDSREQYTAINSATGTGMGPELCIQNSKLCELRSGEYKPVLLRGVNNAHAWFDSYGRHLALQALASIASYGFNAVRIVWTVKQQVQLTPNDLRNIIQKVCDLKMIPIIELHDATGCDDCDSLHDCVHFYTTPEIKSILKDFEEILLVNVANEWSGKGEEFYKTYSSAISKMRGAGVSNILVVDAGGWGQDANSLTKYARVLTSDDPLKKLLFSVHCYEVYGKESKVVELFDKLMAQRIPFIIGEFGPENNGKTVAIAAIMAECDKRGIGYLGWSWHGNNEACKSLDIAADWNGDQLTEWGSRLVNGPHGIKSSQTPL